MNESMAKEEAEKSLFASQDPNRNIHMYYGSATDEMNVSRSKQQ